MDLCFFVYNMFFDMCVCLISCYVSFITTTNYEFSPRRIQLWRWCNETGFVAIVPASSDYFLILVEQGLVGCSILSFNLCASFIEFD